VVGERMDEVEALREKIDGLKEGEKRKLAEDKLERHMKERNKKGDKVMFICAFEDNLLDL
jgi:hypothetical protein